LRPASMRHYEPLQKPRPRSHAWRQRWGCGLTPGVPPRRRGREGRAGRVHVMHAWEPGTCRTCLTSPTLCPYAV
jgi:hypothetical protein